MSLSSSSVLARRGLVLSLALCAAAPAATIPWNPAIGDGSWNDPSNWTTAIVPGPNDSATFDTISGTTPTTPHTVTVPTPVTVADLSIRRTGMTLDIPAGSSLTVTRPGGLGYPTTSGLGLNGGTINAVGTLTTTGFVFGAGRVNGTVQFADNAVGSLYTSGNAAVVGNFQFNGRGEFGGGNIVAGLSLTTRQISAATPGVLTLFSGSPTSPSGANQNYGTITLDAAANLVDSKVSLLTYPANLDTIVNIGTINLNAGSAGTNLRLVQGNLTNTAQGMLNVASGASLTVGGFSTGGGATNQINGVLNTPTFTYSANTVVSGTVNLMGTPLGPLGTPTTDPRRLTINVSNPPADGTFVFHGGGEVTSGSALSSRLTVVAQPVAGAPAAELRMLSSTAVNNGTITLAGNGVADSSVTLYTTVNPSPGDTLTNNGTLNLNAGGPGTNTRTVRANVSNNGTINVAGGVTATLAYALTTSGPVNVATGATLTVGAVSQYGTTGFTIDGTLTASSLVFKTTGPLQFVLRTARSNGFTTGPLRSTTASATRGLGYVTNGTAVTLKATLYGDADLDGGVSINDFNALAASFGAASGKVWVNGDFDYDGGVSINDFNLLAAGFGQSLTGPAAAVDYSGLLAFAAAHDDLVAFEAVTGVPEPTGAVGVMAIAGMAAARRRASPRRGDVV